MSKRTLSLIYVLHIFQKGLYFLLDTELSPGGSSSTALPNSTCSQSVNPQWSINSFHTLFFVSGIVYFNAVFLGASLAPSRLSSYFGTCVRPNVCSVICEVSLQLSLQTLFVCTLVTFDVPTEYLVLT